jgi:hypothetical protein
MDNSKKTTNQERPATQPATPANPSQQNIVKEMTLEQQVEHYKSYFQKSKKLNLYYEGENKKLKERLSQYESGNYYY